MKYSAIEKSDGICSMMVRATWAWFERWVATLFRHWQRRWDMLDDP